MSRLAVSSARRLVACGGGGAQAASISQAPFSAPRRQFGARHDSKAPGPGAVEGHGGARRSGGHRRHVPQAGKASNAAAQSLLGPGMLVDAVRDGRHSLALVTEPDGKTKWWTVDQRGHRASVNGKHVALVLPGAGYSLTDLERFTAAAESADASLLELLWAAACEPPPAAAPAVAASHPSSAAAPAAEAAAPAATAQPQGQQRQALGLAALAQLMFDGADALQQYMTYKLLLLDRVYFRPVPSPRSGEVLFEPRTEAAVEAALKAVAQEEAEAAERRAFADAVAAALAAPRGRQPSFADWRAGPHAARVAAVQDLALRERSCTAATKSLACSSLQLLSWAANADGAWHLLQQLGLARRHDPLPLLRLGVTPGFAAELEAAAQALLTSPPPDPDAGRRQDLTHLTVFTVDDASTTDVDDGLSVEALPDGQVRLWVHVADPTRWLSPGDPLDSEARRRGRTLYLPWGSVPMFPASLSQRLFSLGRGGGGGGGAEAEAEVSCAVSVGVTLGAEGRLASWTATPSLVRVTHRLTYEEADADIALGPLATHPHLQQLYEAARVRKARRAAHGGIDIDLPECKMTVSEGQLDHTTPNINLVKLSQWESASRQMVAEAMIMAGEAVGRMGADAGLLLPFRGQDRPQLPPQRSLDALPQGPCVGYALRRCMTRSSVAARPQFHASLALEAYVQVTSPIRRYSDVVAHFNLKAALRGAPPPFGAAAIESAAAMAATDAARDVARADAEVHRYWAAEFLRQRRGEHWPALVLGWFRAEQGLAAVLLEPLGLEAVVRLDFPASPGDRVELVCSEARVAEGFFRFACVGLLSAAGDGDEGDGEASAASDSGGWSAHADEAPPAGHEEEEDEVASLRGALPAASAAGPERQAGREQVLAL